MAEVKGRDLTRISRDCVEAFNVADWDRMKGLVVEEGKYFEPATNRVVEGLPDMLETWKGWKTAFPDLVGEVTNVFAVEDFSVVEILWRGTHEGTLVTPFGEFTATHKPYTSRAAMVLEFKGDRINTNRHYFDLLSILSQLGIELPVGATPAGF
ncbi:MAG: ester cyclase [Gemmatimonadota bacterium]|nr:MAG: ester cyclase [Gemmatimonadota bacterium]